MDISYLHRRKLHKLFTQVYGGYCGGEQTPLPIPNREVKSAVNVKESEKAYTMELAAPGIKKEYCRVGINDDGNLTIAIENKQEHKHEDSHRHYLRREFSYSNYEQN